MGVPFLTAFINDAKSGFLEPYELHGGYLVIDARSLMSKIFFKTPKYDAFGGDFDTYAHFVSEFFDDLKKCQVTPLLIFDGGKEPKKAKTAKSRWEEQVKSMTNYNPWSKERCRPASTIIVFKDISCQKSIKMCCPVFEADADIAGVAKALNCPVLSNDSDFYLFGVPCIPYSTLEKFSVDKGNNFFIRRCKIFKEENLCREFPGLDVTVLPLIAALLGNDYNVDNLFNDFFKALNIPSEPWERIRPTLNWLRNHNLNDAVADILSKVPEELHRRALNIIELVVNGYMDTPCELLVPLGFEDLYDERMSQRTSKKSFKFRSDIETEEKNFENDPSWFNPDIANTWPLWFAQRYYNAEFPPYFVNIMSSRLYIAPTQIHYSQCPKVAALMSLKIIKVIDGLLVSGRPDDVPGLLYLTMDGNTPIRYRLDETLKGTASIEFPTLDELGNMEMGLKKRIIDDTLGIDGKEHLFQDLPPKWRLYVATIFYWMKSSEEPPRNSCHLYAILLAMLIGVIDQKIDYHRSEYSLKRSFGQKISDILSERQLSKSENPENVSIRENSMMEALEAVTADDCLVAAPFFISQRLIAENLIEFTNEFNVTIIHVFAQFQECFRAAINLNCLLGYPYEHPIISEFYNGTMLYNLCTNFEEKSDVEAYIAAKLENSSSLLNLVKLLIAKMKHILEDEPK